MKEQPDYLSYLLRLWRENVERDFQCRTEQATWRASLESSLTGKRQGFSSLRDLFAFLQQQMDVAVDEAEKDNVV
jgi:hypothetical protein